MAKAVNMKDIVGYAARNQVREIREDEVVGQIYYTKNLKQFRVLEGNREVEYDKKMYEQALEGYLIPILVNEKNEVIDGQHRLYHSHLAGTGIKYIVVNGLTKDDVIRVNINQRKWNLKDFIASYMHEGKEDYKKLFNHINDNVMPTSSLIVIALGRDVESGAGTKIVKNGDFKFHDYFEFISFLDFFERFTNETNMMKDQRKYKQCIALYTIFKVKNVNLERVIKKVKQSKGLDGFIEKNLTRKECLQFLIDTNNNRINESHKDFIEYYINQNGVLVIK